MSLATLIKEFWRFIKENLLRIMMGVVMVVVLVVSGRYFLNRWVRQDTRPAYDYLAEVYQQEPASFQMIVTMEDGSIFSTASLFDDYFSTPQVVQAIEEKTGVQFSDWLEAERTLEMYKTNDFRGGLAGLRDTASNVITMRFLVGKTSEDNLKIAQAYAQMVEEEALPFLDKIQATIIQEPALGEMVPIELTDEVPTDETLTPYQSKEAKGHILYGLMGAILGTLLVVGVLFVRQLFKKVINYAFDYTWRLEDTHLLVDHQRSPEEIQALIEFPSNQKQVIVKEDRFQDDEVLISDNQRQVRVTDLKHLDADFSFDEIVIIIKSHLTTKEWFKDQMDFAHLYPCRVRIIHIV